MVTADGIIVTFEHGDEETEGMQGELFGYWMERAPTPFGTVNRDLNFGGSIISLNNSFLYYHTRGPQTPLSNANIIKENINPAPIGHTTEIHLTNINLTSVTRKAHLSEFDRVHSLVQFTRQLVVQLASELHPQWTSVGDESDDGSVYSDDMDDMPMSSPSTRNPIDSLCTIQFGDALAEALSFSFRSSEGDRAGRRAVGRRRSRDFVLLRNEHVLGPDGRVQLVAAVSEEEADRMKALSRSPSPLHKLGLAKHVALPPAHPAQLHSRHHVEGVRDEGHGGWKEELEEWNCLLPHPPHALLSRPLLVYATPHASFFTALQYHPAVLLFLADHSAAVGAEVQSNLIMWLVNSLFSDVHAIDQGRMDLLRSPVWIVSLVQAAEGICRKGRGEEAAEPQHTRLHAAPVCGRGGAGVGAIPMGQGGGCGAVHVCVGAVGECPVTLHQLYLRQIRLDEPVSPSAHQIAGDQQDESSWSVFAALFPHRHVPIVLPQQRCPPPTSPRPHCPRRVFAVSELLGDEPGTTDATQPLLVAPVLRQQAQDTHLQEERAVFEAKHKVTCLDVVISWRVMTGMSILLRSVIRSTSPNSSPSTSVRVPALKMRAAARSAFLRRCCSTSRSDSVHIRTAEEMLLFDVELRFRPHPYSRRDASVRRRARRLHLTTTSRSAVEDSDAALRIIYSLALPTPHPHHRSTSSREEHASPDNHPRPHNHQSVREVAALVEKALDKRALNLSRDNRNEMQMAARQNTSPSRSILTCSHHPSRLQFSSVPAFYLRHPMHLLLGGKGTVQIDHLLHIRTDTLRLFTSAGIHQQSNVEFFQMRMGQKDPAIALVAAQFLKGHSFLRKD
ncbi:hypothetical protein BLNAU_16545 [Blattamonas nauphoetae]|uniref:Uncharacterized protein n=1 Tax=Blattamonas nauphoetae TaxID=2049346 RepID=A0ABQ9XA45_9EUKA|nr:hypothetical protein BLNAU_16545 [Blattamonas nauphoetae]